ncbi:pimeloyl-ACP methyl ester carboxylesterase [Novosphingobium chloroacetimidivorans]|uniref:Pimeloyl-ACP methyl ester carboxylesterase n=1 Tax=Novosphingobium chloroacetimidivorans TaxID=1428314 RepID=A0A7W7K931_9SPHN|nr:alpha/beta fold hydrolase [Novosphingobium chloroacetimidivorans]MBB4858490.1 pimeloyl-ACP methyl ester carboxylesterase [Novosphingobium chloroacetimidivorans]
MGIAADGDREASAADPYQAILDDLDSRAERIETPCADGTVVWRAWGRGEPLILAHGAQGSWQHWVRNIDSLARDRRVIAVDLPGHGDSALPETLDHRGIAKALAHGLEQILGANAPADLCGFSFGGVCFAHLAAYHPQVARRLILVGCGGLGTPHGEVHLQRVSGLRGEARTAVLRSNLLGLMLHHAESADGLAIHMLLPNAKRARLIAADMVMPDKLLRILPEVRCRVDAIWGEYDRPHPDPALQQAALRSVCPDAGFEVVADAGHWAMYERPQAFERALHGVFEQAG